MPGSSDPQAVTCRVHDWSALLIDDKYFPYFLDFAMTAEDTGLGDIILFLLGADRLRFAPDEGSGCMETIDVAEQYIISHPALRALVPGKCLQELSALRSWRVPLVAKLAVPCDLIWAAYETRLLQVYGQSIAAAPLKKRIINNEELSLLSIVSSTDWKAYFERFIEGSKELMACYNSWNVAVACIENIRYLRCEELVTVLTSPTAGEIGVEVTTPPPSQKLSLKENFMGYFKKSSAADAAVSLVSQSEETTPTKSMGGALAKVTPPKSRRSSMDTAIHRWTVGATPAVGFADNTDYFASVGTCPEYDFTGPYEAFAYLLTAVRSIQACLGDPSLLLHTRPGRAGEKDHMLTDATRLELQTVLTMTSSVRSANTVESVEIDYARTCVHRLARLVHTIETETFDRLSVPFSNFIQSDHYLDLMGFIRCTESTKTTNFLNKLAFLSQVKSLGELHWRDSDDGAYYLKYRHGLGRNTRSLTACPSLKPATASSGATPIMYSHHALVLFRVPNLSEESSCHAWRVEWWQPTEGSDMKPHILSMTPLPCLGDSVESDDGYSGDMSIVQLILGTDRSVPLEGQGGVADVSMTAPRFSCNSDQNLIRSFWSLMTRNYSHTQRSYTAGGSCPNTVVICKLQHGSVGAAGRPTVAFMCADGDYSASEMHAFCSAMEISIDSVSHPHSKCSSSIPLDIDLGSNPAVTSQQMLTADGTTMIRVNTAALVKAFSRTDSTPQSKVKSILDIYRLPKPRAKWVPLQNGVAGSSTSTFWRGRLVSSRSVSLLAVMRLVGGPANMATLVMMLLSGRSMMLLSSSETSVAALRWALQNLVYPFPFVHMFKDLTVDSLDEGSSASLTQRASMVLRQMSAKVNFDKSRARRQSMEDFMKSSGRDSAVVHPTPVLAYASHMLFRDALSLIRSSPEDTTRLTNCFVFDLDSNQFVRHGDESEDELKLIAFCCPSLSYSIQSRGSQSTIQCMHAATLNLIRRIEALQTEWSANDTYHVPDDGSPKEQTVDKSNPDKVAISPTAILSAAGPGCRRKLRRASVILQKKVNVQELDSFVSDATVGVSNGKESFIENKNAEAIELKEKAHTALPALEVEKKMFSHQSGNSLRSKNRREISRGELLVHKNEMVMRCFQLFVAEVFLRYLPEFVEHFPSLDIISCNVERLLEAARSNCSVCGLDYGHLNHSHINRSASPHSQVDNRLDASQNESVSSSIASPSDRRGASSSEHGTAAMNITSPHVLFLSSVTDTLAFSLLLEEHGLALSADVNNPFSIIN